ncbi:MAG: triose-phosphate isomerase [Gammaproteobacteria bacterium]|nr:MAG: triose-phosphate isomerase [Gammaproteobacteria bacterium]
MRKQWVLGNWKMNGSRESNSHLISGLLAGLNAESSSGIGVCVPSVYLIEVGDKLAGSTVALGAQTISEHDEGAYTGEISAKMAVDCGCSLVLVGHSERRSLYGETSEIVAKKFKQALSNELTPVLCVGETLEQRESGITNEVIGEQLDAVIECCNSDELGRSIIAYEPVWAIGTGKTASAEQAQEVHAFIRNKLAQKSNALAEKISILYGGSVKADNAKEIFSMSDIDGGLVGGASLGAESFLAIYNSTDVIG